MPTTIRISETGKALPSRSLPGSRHQHHRRAGCGLGKRSSPSYSNSSGRRCQVPGRLPRSTLRNIAVNVVVQPHEEGLTNPSSLLCEVVRSVSRGRLIKRCGSTLPGAIALVENPLWVTMVAHRLPDFPVTGPGPAFGEGLDSDGGADRK